MGVPYKLLVPLTAALAGGFGLGVGMLLRQPEINELQSQVKLLQGKIGELEETARAQNDEIEGLLAQYQGLKAWHLARKGELREQIGESLMLQYALADYLSLLADRLESHRDYTEEEVAFYSAFTAVLDGKELSVERMEDVKKYVNARHRESIKALEPCDTSGQVNRIKNCDAGSGPGFPQFPKIELPKVELPKVEMPNIVIPLPWNKKDGE